MNKRAALSLLTGFLCVFCNPLSAAKPGSQFLNEPAGARSAALGNSSVADTANGETFFSNPASLASMDATRLWLTHNQSILDSNTNTVGLAVPFQSSGLGLAGRYFSEDKFERTEVGNNGEPTGALGSFRPYTALMRVSAAHRWQKTSLGFGVSGWSEKIDRKSATSWSSDAGLLHDVKPWATVGLVRRNLGPEVRNFPLPSNWGAGVSIHPALKGARFVNILSEYRVPDFGSSALALGVEFGVPAFALRIGHPDVLARNANDVFRFSLGAGVKLRGIQADYAWQDAGDFGQQHLFTVSFAMGQTADEKMLAAHQLDLAMTEQMSKRAASLNSDGAIALEKGEWDRAVDSFSQALTWDSNNATARAGLKTAVAERKQTHEATLRADAARFIKEQEWIDAAAALRELQKLAPGDPRIEAQLQDVSTHFKKSSASNLFERGSQNYINGNYQFALQEWKTLQATEPSYPQIREYIAKAQNKILEDRLQVQTTQKAENPAEAMSRTAYIYYSLGKTDEAIALWQKVVVLNPDSGDAKQALENAQARRSLSDNDATADSRTLSEDLNRQALKQYSEGHRESAVAIWKKALILDPNNARIKNNLQRVESEIATDEISK